MGRKTMSEIAALQQEITNLKKENLRLSKKLQARNDELREVKAENRELKLRPAPRTFVDADDERESNAWREKANNLLALLDDLQVSMKDDLINLEAETLAPGSSTLSTVTVTKSSTTTTTTPAADAADADGEEAVSPSSSRKRKHHHHHHKRRSKSPEPLEQVVEKVKEVITLDADDDVEEATPAGAGASGAGGANTEGLTAAFKSLGSSAKYIHQRYNELKKTTGAAATIWADNSDPVKKAAKTAKAAAGHRNEPIDFEADVFTESALEAAQAAKDWAANVKTSIHSQAGAHSPAIKAAAKALHSSGRKVASATSALDLSSQESVAELENHANALSDALRELIDAEAKGFWRSLTKIASKR